MGLKVSYTGLKQTYMGLIVSYMGLKLSYVGPKLTFSKEALVEEEWNTKDSEKGQKTQKMGVGQKRLLKRPTAKT